MNQDRVDERSKIIDLLVSTARQKLDKRDLDGASALLEVSEFLTKNALNQIKKKK